MNKLLAYKRYLIRDIIITLLLVLASIPLWMSFDISLIRDNAKYYDNYNYIAYEYLNDEVSFDSHATSDEMAIRKVTPQDILVYNASNTRQDYNLLLKLNKNENIDNLKISVNFEVKPASEYVKYEDGNYYYFILDSKNIVASSQKYLVSLWNNKSDIDKTIDSKIMVG